jgi:hypothetical protein
MGAQNHEELVCWQLAVEFRDRVIAVLARPVFKRRFKYCDQLEDAVESMASNIAEASIGTPIRKSPASSASRLDRLAKHGLASDPPGRRI